MAAPSENEEGVELVGGPVTPGRARPRRKRRGSSAQEFSAPKRPQRRPRLMLVVAESSSDSEGDLGVALTTSPSIVDAALAIDSGQSDSEAEASWDLPVAPQPAGGGVSGCGAGALQTCFQWAFLM